MRSIWWVIIVSAVLLIIIVLTVNCRVHIRSSLDNLRYRRIYLKAQHKRQTKRVKW